MTVASVETRSSCRPLRTPRMAASAPPRQSASTGIHRPSSDPRRCRARATPGPTLAVTFGPSSTGRPLEGGVAARDERGHCPVRRRRRAESHHRSMVNAVAAASHTCAGVSVAARRPRRHVRHEQPAPAGPPIGRQVTTRPRDPRSSRLIERHRERLARPVTQSRSTCRSVEPGHRRAPHPAPGPALGSDGVTVGLVGTVTVDSGVALSSLGVRDRDGHDDATHRPKWPRRAPCRSTNAVAGWPCAREPRPAVAHRLARPDPARRGCRAPDAQARSSGFLSLQRGRSNQMTRAARARAACGTHARPGCERCPAHTRPRRRCTLIKASCTRSSASA